MIFYKYHGTGNDFVLIDNRVSKWAPTEEQVKKICSRHFGVGADGLLIIEDSSEADFNMLYYNADGRKSSMCGNGGRCAVKYAKQVGIVSKTDVSLLAADGLHFAKILENGHVALKMNFSPDHELRGQAYILDTGSPHYVRFKYNLDSMNMIQEGRMVRNSAQYKTDGINVNFVEETIDGLKIRTYERGVEDETLSCGTGVTAAAIAWFFKERKRDNQLIKVHTLGGQLHVQIEVDDNKEIEHVWLVGPAKEVFIGEIEI